LNLTDPVAVLCRHHHETDPEQLILRLCRQLLAECPTGAGLTPLHVLGSCQGVRSYNSKPIHPEAGCSGLLIPSDGGYEITVNSSEPQERQNFSIAHEIVHTFFRDACPCIQPTPQEEELCNLGAAELTMPAGRFTSHLAAAGLTFAGIDSCKQEFAVSFAAAARRAVNLTREQACLFTAAPGGTAALDRPDADRSLLRITRWRPSPSWRQPQARENDPVTLASLPGQAFVHQDERRGQASLGLQSHPGTYLVEARGYAYPLPCNPDHHQVVTLARVLQTENWAD
jgi:hypothetical protein